MKHKLTTILIFLSTFIAGTRADITYTNAYEAMALFTTVLEEVHRSYTDPEDADYDSLIRHAIAGMLQGLDPYSQFLDKDEYLDMKEDTSGHFGGVGIVISMKDGALTVISPMDDTPAFRAGILAHDIILEIDGQETLKMTMSDAIKVMRGTPGSQVTLKTLRPDTRAIEEIVLTREEINVASVKNAELIEPDIGYIRITQFNEPTGANLKSELETLASNGMRGLVLDLRDNPGGLLTAAAEVAELFLPKGALIVFTKSADGGTAPLRYASTGDTHYLSDELPLVILINGGSASASEIVSGALQDHKRAMLIGEKSFGKGSVQSLLPLEDGSAVKLTTAKYYTPSERIIHGNGIEPDHSVALDAETLYKLRMQQDDEVDAEVAALSPPTEHDTQLEAAVGALKGMIILQEWTQ